MTFINTKSTELYCKAKSFIYTALHNKKGDGGAVSWIVGIAVVLLIAVAMFTFKDKVNAYLGKAGDFIESNDNFQLPS